MVDCPLFDLLVDCPLFDLRVKKKTLPPEEIKKIKEEAESQLNKYSRDEKFRKSIGPTTLKKLVLIFSGNRMVYHSEI